MEYSKYGKHQCNTLNGEFYSREYDDDFAFKYVKCSDAPTECRNSKSWIDSGCNGCTLKIDRKTAI